jgi:hypothetical protein
MLILPNGVQTQSTQPVLPVVPAGVRATPVEPAKVVTSNKQGKEGDLKKGRRPDHPPHRGSLLDLFV